MSRSLYIGCMTAITAACFFLWVFLLPIGLRANFGGGPEPALGLAVVSLVPVLFGAIATITFTGFRLSDMGQPPLAAMLVLVPFVGLAIVIWCALSPGQPQESAYY